MTSASQLERLTHVQLIQKIIHLESELAHCNMKKEQNEDQYKKQMRLLIRQNESMKSQLQEMLEEKESYETERDELIRDYNELMQQKGAFENQSTDWQRDNDFQEVITQNEAYASENAVLQQLVDELKMEIAVYKVKEESLFMEWLNLQSQPNEGNYSYEEKISNLEQENASLQEKIHQLTEQKLTDDKRFDNINANLNEVFKETKQLVSMTSSLKQQLEAKIMELSQLKKEKQILIVQVSQLKNLYENSEIKNAELEGTVESLKADFLTAKHFLARLEQFESENRQLKEELRTIMEEMEQLTKQYDSDKQACLADLYKLQKEMEKYKQKADQFDQEKEVWTKEIEGLNSKLAQTKEHLGRIEELGKGNTMTDQLANSQNITMQQMEWFHRIKSQEYNTMESANQKKKPAPPADFYTLKRKADQSTNASSIYTVQKKTSNNG